MNHFVTHLEAAIDGTKLPFGQLHGMHNGRPIWVRYDLDAIRKAVTPEQIAARPPSLWRYRELLPLPIDVEPVDSGRRDVAVARLPTPGQFARARRACSSRTNRSCRRAASSSAAWRWRSAWRSISASNAWPCRPPEMRAALPPLTRRGRASSASSSCPRTRPPSTRWSRTSSGPRLIASTA